MGIIMEQSKKRQITIAVIYVTIFLVVASLIYYAIRPEPNCFDGKLNQDEEKIDCGGICEKKCELIAEKNIQIEKVGFVESGAVNRYDLYAEISNPNSFLGSNDFQYDFKLLDSSGKIIMQKTGKDFILPGEKKYVIELNVETGEKPSQAEFGISNVVWKEFSNYQKPQIEIVNKYYSEISNGAGFSEAKGLLKNESQFDFTSIKVHVILKDNQEKIIALNSTLMNTVKAGENREFRAFWSSRFPGSVGNMEVKAEVNVFNSESFLKRYFKADKFQSLE